MAHSSQLEYKSIIADAIKSLLKVDDKGWNIQIFEDQNKISACFCEHCDCICVDAVELGCDHSDNDILLYCNDCLKQLIKENNHKCPLNGHGNPSVVSSRFARRQIVKAAVMCPYSTAYKMKVNAAAGAQIIDTMGNDEKEGNPEVNIAVYQDQVYGNKQLQMQMNAKRQNNVCNWRGTLNDLINNHLAQCTKTNNSSFVLNIQNKDLKHKNKQLNAQINRQKSEIAQFKIQLNEKNALIQKLNSRLNASSAGQSVHRLQNEINALKKKKNFNDWITCKKCATKYDDGSNAKGECVHVGDWHSEYSDCNKLKCALGLTTNIGKSHWCCCYSVEYDSKCKKSGKHEPMPNTVKLGVGGYECDDDDEWD